MWRYRYTNPLPTYGELMHYGITGQKWGVRRFQYDNGSYTPEGKERYGRGKTSPGSDGKTGWLFFKKKYKPPFRVDRIAMEKDFDASIKENSDVADRILKNGDKLVDQANALSKSYTEHLNSMKFSDEKKEKVWDEIFKDFGVDGVDDDELYELVVSDLVHDEIIDSLTDGLPKKIKEERKSFDNALDQYWKDVKKISDPVLQKYKDKYVKDLDKQSSWDPVDVEISELRKNKLGTDFIAYMSRHFDDYWVFDTPEYYKAAERIEAEFSLEEYRERSREKRERRQKSEQSLKQNKANSQSPKADKESYANKYAKTKMTAKEAYKTAYKDLEKMYPNFDDLPLDKQDELFFNYMNDSGLYLWT